MNDVKVQDALAENWVDRYAPLRARPFLRLSRMDRPVGAWLLFLPCAFAAMIGGAQAGVGIGAVLHVLIVCGLGSILMRGAGCTWNDIVDRKIDAKVERTKSRPLPSGQVTTKAAVIWMIAQMAVASILLLTFRMDVVFLTLVSLVIVAAYPFAKRVTHWPQVVLGMAFNWGVLTVWLQITGELSWAALILYLAMLIWTVFYDTIYAFQDIEDDVMIGVKSSAQATQSDPAKWLMAFVIGVGALLVMLAVLIGAGFAWLAVVIFVVQLEILRRQFDPQDTKLCLAQFIYNVRIGQIFWFFLICNYMLRIF